MKLEPMILRLQQKIRFARKQLHDAKKLEFSILTAIHRTEIRVYQDEIRDLMRMASAETDRYIWEMKQMNK